MGSSIFLPPPFRYSQTHPLSHLYPRLTRCRSLSLSSYRWCSRPFTISVVLRWTPSREIPVFLEVGSPELVTNHQAAVKTAAMAAWRGSWGSVYIKHCRLTARLHTSWRAEDNICKGGQPLPRRDASQFRQEVRSGNRKGRVLALLLAELWILTFLFFFSYTVVLSSFHSPVSICLFKSLAACCSWDGNTAYCQVHRDMGAWACKNWGNPIKCNRIPTITWWHIQITRQCCIPSIRDFWVFPAALRMLLDDPRSYNLDTTTSGLICTMVALTWATLLRGESLELILQWKSVRSLREKPSWYYCGTHPLLNYLLQP